MKKYILLFAAVATLAACNNQKTAGAAEESAAISPAAVTPENAAAFKFEKEAYDFGQITEGEKVSYDFRFKNVGKNPLIITEAKASCGCTVPDYPHEPIAPGQEGKISVVFNSTGKSGLQNKVVTIFANTIPSSTEVRLVGDVKSKSNN